MGLRVQGLRGFRVWGGGVKGFQGLGFFMFGIL